MSRPACDPAHTEVLVVGGGPAGSTAAALLARRGRRVVVLERETFPRFHIGESLLPDGNAVLAELGIAAADLERCSVEKRGALFVSPDGVALRRADFLLAYDTPQPRTFHVLRAQFDALLLERAAAVGADVWQGWQAQEARMAPDGVTLTVAGPAGRTATLHGQVLVDASGRAGFLSSRLGLRRPEPSLRKVALYAHYEGVEPPPTPGDIRVILRPRDTGWIWLIPLPEGRASVGVVVDVAAEPAARQRGPQQAMDALLGEVPGLQPLLRTARRVGPVRREGDFSYFPTAYAGDRWLLAGDAGGFLDPIFSTGVHLAMVSGSEAASAVDAALGRGGPSARRFRAYDRRMRRRYRHFRRFVMAFYEAGFRDVFLSSGGGRWLVRAVTTILAGVWRPSWRTRLGVVLFFALVAVQRRWGVIRPRMNRNWMAAPAAGGRADA